MSEKKSKLLLNKNTVKQLTIKTDVKTGDSKVFPTDTCNSCPPYTTSGNTSTLYASKK